MTTCRDCQHYEFILDDMDGNAIESESCNAPLPIWIDTALRRLDFDPEDYWDSSKAGEFCEAFKEAE